MIIEKKVVSRPQEQFGQNSKLHFSIYQLHITSKTYIEWQGGYGLAENLSLSEACAKIPSFLSKPEASLVDPAPLATTSGPIS